MVVTPDMVRSWLARVAQHQDSRAFRQFFDYFYKEAYRLAFFYVQDRETAEEVVADVFLKIWNRGESLQTVLHPRTYLLTAVKNHCINQLRQLQPEVLSLDDDRQQPACPTTPGPDQEMVWDEMQQVLDQAVAALPTRCGLIFRLVREQQLSYRDVAESLGISPKTVEIQMGIALKRLSKLVEPVSQNRLITVVALFFSCFF